jgi:hypothetical protein
MLKTSPELLAYQKQYRIDNKEKIKEQRNKYREANRDNINKAMKIACHYTNMQPLWGKDNIKKGAKYDGTITLD